GRLEIAGEQDHASRRRVAQAFLLLRGELEARDIEHDRAGFHFARRPLGPFPSTTTKAPAIPSSSVSDRWTRSIPRCSRSAASACENSNDGLPERSLTTQTLCQLTGYRMPTPRAFENASLAAKRLAR